MSKLKLRGRIQYPPGPWGAFRPVTDAKITITDLDLPGRHNDTIFSGVTDAKGCFRGISNEWQDTVRVRYWSGSRWTYRTQPDITDILTLMIKIEADGKEVTLPFPFPGDDIEVPLPVTWAPLMPSAWGTVNGIRFTDFQKLMDQLIATVEEREPIEIKLFGGWADAMTPLVDLIQKPPLELAQEIFPGSRPGSLILAIGAFTLVVGIGGLILLAGAGVFLTAMGIAVIMAVSAGYCEIGATQSTTTDPDGQTINETGITLNNTGC